MKFRTTLGVFLIALLCAGCSSEVTSWQINLAISKCENSQGVSKINLVTNDVICNDGTMYGLTTTRGT